MKCGCLFASKVDCLIVRCTDAMAKACTWVGPVVGWGIDDYNDKPIFTSMTAAQCMTLCEQETSIVCNSVDYNGFCYLSSVRKDMVPSAFNSLSGFEYYERVCE